MDTQIISETFCQFYENIIFKNGAFYIILTSEKFKVYSVLASIYYAWERYLLPYHTTFIWYLKSLKAPTVKIVYPAFIKAVLHF